MRNKNTFITLLVIFAAICVYHLTLTVMQFRSSGKLEAARKAAVVADSKPDSLRTAADSTAIKAYTELLNDRDFQDNYDWTVKNSFNLGLDLQGGMFVTLEVGVDAIVRQLAGTAADTTFERAMKIADAKQNAGDQRSYITLFDEAMLQVAPNGKLGAYFASPDRQISFDTPREKVLEMLQKEADDAVDRTFNIIRTRVDQFGVVAPNLQKQSGTGRILLELPGVKDPDRVRKLLRSTAKLEFWETHKIGDAYKVLTDVNTKLKAIKGITTEADTTKKDSAGKTIVKKDSTAADTNIADTDTASMSQEEQANKFRRENPLFAVLQLPDPQSITENSPVVGYSAANDTAKVNGFLRMEEIKAVIPQDMKFSWTFKPLEGTENIFTLVALKANLEGGAALSGEAVSSARMNFDDRGRAIVEMGMNAEGADEWARVTAANVGNSVAILLDGYVYSFPVVQNEIKGGNSQISGNFTIEEAKDLANVLKAGQLPVPARIEGEDVVGPSLGEQNIGNGLMSFLAALLLTFVFMAWYYAKAGWYANLALVINMIFLLGMSAGFNIVLTMSGIGAIVLTIGMAVDANVLIYERIREELDHGKTLKAGIKAGFSNAFSSIVDANVTTFLTGAVLYIFGVGPIRGFAVSLMIGIVTTLICGLLVTRLIMDYFANKGGESMSFGSKFSLNLFKGMKLNFLHVKKRWYLISGTLVALSLVSIALFGFKLGVDFKGGRQFTYTFFQGTAPFKLENAAIERVRAELTTAFKGESPVIKTLASDNQLQITSSYLSEDRAATEQVEKLITETLKKVLPSASATRLSLADVGPTVAADIKNAAFYSVIGSLVMIFLYVLIRFRKWQYSLGSIVALFHDVIITMGVFSFLGFVGFQWFDVEMNQNLIAALLTIIGFSINDTVVVFDRLRENVNEHKGMELGKVYDLAIDQTLSRTIITSLTVFLTTLVLFIFGGDSIRGFVFAFMIGVIVGTYSSIFVASGIAYDMQVRNKKDSDDAAAPVAA